MTPRLVLTSGALAFGAAGTVVMLLPTAMGLVDVTLPTATARTDLRAVLGGIHLALGVFLAWSSLEPRRHRSGVMAMTLGIGGMVAGRLLGIALDGEVSAITVAFLIAEAIGLGLAAFGLHRTPG